MNQRLERVIGLSGLSIRSKLNALVVVLVGVIGLTIWFSAHSTSEEHIRVVVDNVAGRQPVLAQQYAREVIAVGLGSTGDPDGTRVQLIANGDALLDGGRVNAVQGNDLSIVIPGASDPSVRAKITEENRLAHELFDQGDALLRDEPGSVAYSADVVKLNNLAELTSNVGFDAVGRMTVISDRSVSANARRQIVLASIGIALALACGWLLGRQIVRRLRSLGDVARAAAAGDLSIRNRVTSDDEIGLLGRAFNEMADSLSGVLARLERDAVRDGFVGQLVEAFEMADTEAAAHNVVELAMGTLNAAAPMELLLADDSRAHLKRVAEQASVGAPGCGVESPYSCVAVRRGNPVVFPSSDALNACPHLRGHDTGSCSAACVPVTFMGKALGVLHTTGPEGQPPSPAQVERLSVLATQAGARIGTVRATQQTQLQAATDGLTGLVNRRTLENETRALLSSRRRFALVIADLDHFKILNDTYGHEAGDRALRLYARVVRDAMRSEDIGSRYGGEEFVFVFPDTDTVLASEIIQRMRDRLAQATEHEGSPPFTASYGIVDTDASDNLDELVRLADRALFIAKRDGRDRIQIAKERHRNAADGLAANSSNGAEQNQQFDKQSAPLLEEPVDAS